MWGDEFERVMGGVVAIYLIQKMEERLVEWFKS
jgi:hypothetical protein